MYGLVMQFWRNEWTIVGAVARQLQRCTRKIYFFLGNSQNMLVRTHFIMSSIYSKFMNVPYVLFWSLDAIVRWLTGTAVADEAIKNQVSRGIVNSGWATAETNSHWLTGHWSAAFQVTDSLVTGQLHSKWDNGPALPIPESLGRCHWLLQLERGDQLISRVWEPALSFSTTSFICKEQAQVISSVQVRCGTTLLEQDLFYRIVPLHPLPTRRQALSLVDDPEPLGQSVIDG